MTTNAINASEIPTFTILIPAGTTVGFSFQQPWSSKAITGTTTLIADAIIDRAIREEDGSWKYSLSPGRTYFCAGGLATVLPVQSPGLRLRQDAFLESFLCSDRAVPSDLEAARYWRSGAH